MTTTHPAPDAAPLAMSSMDVAGAARVVTGRLREDELVQVVESEDVAHDVPAEAPAGKGARA